MVGGVLDVVMAPSATAVSHTIDVLCGTVCDVGVDQEGRHMVSSFLGPLDDEPHVFITAVTY